MWGEMLHLYGQMGTLAGLAALASVAPGSVDKLACDRLNFDLTSGSGVATLSPARSTWATKTHRRGGTQHGTCGRHRPGHDELRGERARGRRANSHRQR